MTMTDSFHVNVALRIDQSTGAVHGPATDMTAASEG
jgi:hypothetical protein